MENAFTGQLLWIFNRGNFGLRVLSLPASTGASVCVCMCVRPCVYQSLACPRDNSSHLQARITKFGVEVQNTLVDVSIVFRVDRPWPSRSKLTSKSNFSSFWDCPHDNLSLVQARIVKFGGLIDLDLQSQI